ncbi:abscission/NoCut checkpoint regulator [Lucilia cuprina]|uniref:abscission/NoCut checkpoint regulator n=1 Tax=Lucilia cuprina TaxID=7375 RepID=UPI001F05CD0E|nr:abscission/NoCut checkpoint regulator [Lucilia cuprina]XP_046803621.1 abscission/NoCut checkpoint regulator [Lucilia cuprina]
MSCFGCSRKYGLFCKEYGCPNCGYSYCAKCLKRPVAVPRHNNKVMNVCLICYDKLSKLQEVEKVIDVETLPGTIVTKANKGMVNEQIVQKDINALLEVEPSAALVGEVLEPISPVKMTSSTHSSGENSDITENLDSAILQRLKNLKASDPSSFPSDDEIRSRLSKLNGMPQKDYSKKDLLLNTDQRTDQEKMNDLLAQFMGEAEIDNRLETKRNDTLSDIERRLKALRDDPVTTAASGSSAIGTTTSSDTNTPSDNEMDDETMLKGIMEKYLAEARLPEAPNNLETELAAGIPPPPTGVDTEELPWCNICNEDAVFRCKGCDGELFCAQCYRECHDDDEEYRAHVKEPYSAPPKFKEDHF